MNSAAVNVFPLPHPQRRENKRRDEIKNERRGQHHAAVKRHLERHEKSARRRQVDQVNVHPLRVGEGGTDRRLTRQPST